MKTKIWIAIIGVMFLGLIAAGYFLYDFSKQNKELASDNTQLSQQLSETTDGLDESEKMVASLTDEVDALSSENDDLTQSMDVLQSENDLQRTKYDQLNSNYDELYDFTYCGDELIELDDMNYRSNVKALESLTDWVDVMWGDVLGSYWWDFWSADEPALHIIETGYANDYFIVYFEQQDFMDAPNAVFIVSHHCWLDVELDS